jgi:hypothetical protein
MNIILLWHKRKCATFIVTPFIRTISPLKSNWYASPGASDNGTQAAAV